MGSMPRSDSSTPLPLPPAHPASLPPHYSPLPSPPSTHTHLQSDLHGVHAQVRLEPLLGGLEHEGQAAEVGHVEGLEGLHGLGGVLAGRATHEGKAWCRGGGGGYAKGSTTTTSRLFYP